MRNLELLAAVNKIGGWLKVLMKIFVKTSDICHAANPTEGPTNYIPLVREDRLDSSCITFRQIPSVSLSKPPYGRGRYGNEVGNSLRRHETNR